MTGHDSVLYAAMLIVKGPFRNLWPLIAVPAMALLISNRTARFVPRTAEGSAPAAALAAVPGLVGLVVICLAIDINKIITWRDVVLHWLTPLAAGGLMAYAVVRALHRQALVIQLFMIARPACGLLATTATQLGLRALEIPSEAKHCLVAGVLRPTVFVSSGALTQLGEAELRAALCHERVHVRGRDTLLLSILAFLRDLAPWGRAEALDAFRTAREAAADEAAARSAGRLNLAAAIVALARRGPGAGDDSMLHMSGGDSLSWRMQVLLDGDPRGGGPSGGIWIKLATGLCLSAGLLAWPVVQLQLMLLFCIHIQH